jgi:RNA polymerase sigma factor (sigma-70 family)
MTGSMSLLRSVPVRRNAREDRFRELFERHFRDLLGYALRRTSAPEDASDIVADTMLVAWRRFDEIPPGREARLWLYGVARRVLANQRRGTVRHERLGDRLRQQLQAVTPDVADSVTSTVAIREALERLGEDDRELIRLTAWEGLAPRDAAVVLGVPPRTVRSRLHRARARLREEVGDAFAEYGHVSGEARVQLVQEER